MQLIKNQIFTPVGDYLNNFFQYGALYIILSTFSPCDKHCQESIGLRVYKIECLTVWKQQWLVLMLIPALNFVLSPLMFLFFCLQINSYLWPKINYGLHLKYNLKVLYMGPVSRGASKIPFILLSKFGWQSCYKDQ